MKVKDLDPETNLQDIQVRVPEGHEDTYPFEDRIGYWRGQWGYSDGKAGVWLKRSLDEDRIYPVCIDNLKETLEWEVIE